MKQEMMQAMSEVARPERLAWYRDLVEEMTGCTSQVKHTTRPVLIDGLYWQVVYVEASLPAFVSPAGYAYEAVREYAETEEEALRVLCERVHALTWAEQEVWVMYAAEPDVAQLAGVM